jgi:hypothetical protein
MKAQRHMTHADYTGFAYLVRNAHDKEFLLSASFGPSRNQAKKYLSNIQHQRCLQHRPMLEVVELLEVNVTVVQRIAP